MIESLRVLLEPRFQIVGTARDGPAAIAGFRDLHPDLLLLGISLPVLNGIEVTRRIRAFAPSARIIILTMHNDRTYLQAAFDAGAAAYVLKQSASRELFNAIEIVMGGASYVSPQIRPRPGAGQVHSGAHAAKVYGGRLTAREREVVRLVSEGRSGREIADNLKISPRTVEFHKRVIFDRLGLRSVGQLVRYAFRHGIVS
jgi:DNA-binding NarL/FixJ family response regulator